MTAVLVPAATEAEWLEARRQGITASEIGTVMGLSPWGSPFELYHRKLGNLPPLEDNDAMERGRVLEPVVAGKFAALHPEFGIGGDGRALFAHIDRPWQMATPDRIIYEAARISGPNLAVLECKTTGSWDDWGEDGSDQIPVHYRCQVLWQCDVLGVGAWYVAALNPGTWKLRVYGGVIDDQAEDDLGLMRAEGIRFICRLRDGDEPEPDWRPATAAALKHLHPDLEDREVMIPRQLAISYRAALKHCKAAERRRDEMTNRMLALIGNGRTAIEANTGLKLATRQVYDVPARTIERKAFTVNKLVPASTRKGTP